MIPIYVVIGTGLITGCILEEIVNIPKHIRNYQETQNFMKSDEIYVDIDTYYKKRGRSWNDNLLDSSKEYKDYIYICNNDKLVKAPLKINKFTRQYAYVYDGKVICGGDDIEQYRLKKFTTVSS